MRRWLRRVASMCLAAGVACTPSEGDGPQKAPDIQGVKGDAVGAYADTWVLALAKDVSSVQALLGSNPDQGWQQLYQHNYEAASAAFAAGSAPSDAVGHARAELSMAELFNDAHRLAVDVLAQTELRLKENTDRIATAPAAGFFASSRALQAGDASAAQAAAESFLKAHPSHTLSEPARAVLAAAQHALGQTDRSAATLAAVKSPDGLAVAAAMFAWVKGPSPSLPDEAGLSIFGKRALVFARVERGQLDEASALASSLEAKAPDFAEWVGEGDARAERKQYDPLILAAMARLHARRAAESIAKTQGPAAGLKARADAIQGAKVAVDLSAISTGGTTPEMLPVLVFGSLASPSDYKALLADLSATPVKAGLEDRFLEELGAVKVEPDQGRQVREAQDLGKAWEQSLSDAVAALPEGDGVSMAQGLKLPRGLVASLLRARAHQFIDGGKALEGLALLEYTFEKEQSSHITWINAPHLFLDTTRAYCELDRYREALNYLYRLVDTYPQLWSVYEVLGNLSVLDGLDRLGVDGQ